MAAGDTVASMAVMTRAAGTRGTIYQHTHFLRPAAGGDLRVEANVLRFGRTSAFVETKITNPYTEALVAHATLEFAI
jgi:acyl-coenzyme A thioesterase PaaI-like protein